MKKYLVLLVVLCSIVFLFSNNVKAESVENIMNYVSFTNLYGLTDEEMLELGNSVGVDLTAFIESYNIHKSKLNLNNFIYSYENGMGKTILYKDTDTLTFNIKNSSSSIWYIYIEDRNPTNKVTARYNTWGGTTLYSPSQSAYTLTSSGVNISNSSNHSYIFYISDIEEDIYFKYTPGYSGSGWFTGDINIDGTIYSINDVTPISLKTGYNSNRNYGYIYEDTLDVTNIESIKFIYDIEEVNLNLKDFNYHFKLNYQEEQIEYNGVVYSNDFITPKFTYSFKKENSTFVKNYGFINVIPKDGLWTIDQDLDYYAESGWSIRDLDYYIEELYLTVDLFENYGNNIYLYMNSEYLFNVLITHKDGTQTYIDMSNNTVEESTTTSNYVKIDLKNYSGIYLSPLKFKDGYNYSNSAILYFSNKFKYDITVFDSYYNIIEDFDEQTANPYSIDLSFSKFSELQDYYILIKKNISEDLTNQYIVFDSTIFNYTLYTDSSSSVEIESPNFGGPVDIYSPDSIDNIVKNEEGFSFITFIDDINESLKYVHNVFTIFFNKLPFLIKGLFIFVFNILCIFMLLRMGGWIG